MAVEVLRGLGSLFVTLCGVIVQLRLRREKTDGVSKVPGVACVALRERSTLCLISV